MHISLSRSTICSKRQDNKYVHTHTEGERRRRKKSSRKDGEEGVGGCDDVGVGVLGREPREGVADVGGLGGHVGARDAVGKDACEGREHGGAARVGAAVVEVLERAAEERDEDGEVLRTDFTVREENGILVVTLLAECREQIGRVVEFEGQVGHILPGAGT